MAHQAVAPAHAYISVCRVIIRFKQKKEHVILFSSTVCFTHKWKRVRTFPVHRYHCTRELLIPYNVQENDYYRKEKH